MPSYLAPLPLVAVKRLDANNIGQGEFYSVIHSGPHERGLMTSGNKSIRPAALLGICPAIDATDIQAGDVSNALKAA